MEYSQQQQREDFSNRRQQLLRQSLSEHYTKLFVQSSPRLSSPYQSQGVKVNHLDDDVRDTPPSSSSSLSSSSNAAVAASSPLRWEQANTFGPRSTCYCFSESRRSFWSFQWCPQAGVFQGRQDKDGSLQPRYTLGRLRHNIGVEDHPSSRSYQQHLAEVARSKYPDAVDVELYVDGDPCETEIGVLRTSVVVIHKHTSDQCPDFEEIGNDTPTRPAPMILARVDEPKICEYIVHVCTSPSPDVDGNPVEAISSSHFRWDPSDTLIAESDVREINRTISRLQLNVNSYLHQTDADAKQKATADVLTSLHIGLPPMPQSKIQSNLKLIKDMVMHAYDGYFYHGFPASEVKPITCKPSSFSLVKIPGLTLIDTLDTLVIVGNYSEFARAVERLKQLNDHMAKENGIFSQGGLFALNQNVSVFETNIRVLGGLLSSHQLAEAFLNRKVYEHQVWADDKSILFGASGDEDCEVMEVQESPSLVSDCNSPSMLNCQQESPPKAVCRNRTSSYWVYDGFLLELARDIGDRLLPAFDTRTGIPYGTVNLLSGIPEGETTVASLAGGGTLSLEMELLSRLTGNEEYGRAAKLAARALWMRRSPCGLLGKHICTRRGDWTETLSGIGSNSDSYYEYLVKHHILFPEDDDFWIQLVSAYSGVHNESRLGEWYGDVDMGRGVSGGGSRRVFEALMAFYPGMQVLLGEITPAARTLNSFFLVREYLGFLPERFNYGAWKVDSHGGKHLLRPELLESAYFLHRASKGVQHQFRSRSNSTSRDASGWQWAADFALHTLEKLTRTQCGYGSLRQLSSTTTGALNAEKNQVKLLNEMPSYFLSETLKYLYLVFDDNNILHSDENRDWVFTTEAHPIHHEEKSRGKRQSLLERQKGKLEQRIRSRLKRIETKVRPAFDGLYSEKWTEGSNFRTYREQLEPLWVAGYTTYETRKAKPVPGNDVSFFPHVTEPFLPNESSFGSFDKFNERLVAMNPSYLSFPSLGKSIALTKACPNLYLTDLLWIRALNGGIADYADTYMSRVQDNVSVLGLSSVALGSVDALALHGTGAHVKSMFDLNGRCPVRDPKAAYGKQSTGSESSTEKQNSGLVQVDMGEGLGSFEVSAFPGGTGFYVQHIESGETVMVTLIEGEASHDEGETYMLVYSSIGAEDVGDEERPEETDDDSLASRAVIMADLKGSAYSCVVQIVASTMDFPHDSRTSTCDVNEKSYRDPSQEEVEVLAQYPCAPALFGPSHLSHLRLVDTVHAEAAIQSPTVGNEYGCEPPGDVEYDEVFEADELADEVCKFSVIQMVHRGICTFQQKSKNLKQAGRAEAVIVINTEDDELFVMSGGGIDETTNTADDDEFPLTVLVTGSDGQSLIDIVDSFEKNERSQLLARITLLRGETELTTLENGALSVTGNRFWPGVRANTDGVQIFSRSGWGVHALLKASRATSVEREWQLFLLTHSVQP
jgi:mannosidase alpha-like ER degradation enhancer 2